VSRLHLHRNEDLTTLALNSLNGSVPWILLDDVAEIEPGMLLCEKESLGCPMPLEWLYRSSYCKDHIHEKTLLGEMHVKPVLHFLNTPFST